MYSKLTLNHLYPPLFEMKTSGGVVCRVSAMWPTGNRNKAWERKHPLHTCTCLVLNILVVKYRVYLLQSRMMNTKLNFQIIFHMTEICHNDIFAWGTVVVGEIHTMGSQTEYVHSATHSRVKMAKVREFMWDFVSLTMNYKPPKITCQLL